MSSPEGSQQALTHVVVISCQVLQDLLTRLLLPEVAQDIVFMDYGLHRVPGRMTGTLQEEIDRLEQPSLVVLGYGLCGNGLKGLRSGRHTLLVPRVDDCIALLLGSYQAYMHEFQAVPGTYYLSKGWLESGSHPLKEYEEYVPKYGPEQAMWIMDQQYQHYERLVLVAHDQADLEAYRAQAQEVAHFCERWGMRYEEVLGSDRYVRKLVHLIQRLALSHALSKVEGDVEGVALSHALSKVEGDVEGEAEGVAALEQTDGDFLIIPPGGEIRQEQFMR